MNQSEVVYFIDRLQGLVRDLTFDLKHEKHTETQGYLTNTIRHLQNSIEVMRRIEPGE